MFAYVDHFEDKSVSEWSVDDVGMWLETIGCSEHKSIFKQHDIRGQELIKLGRQDLIVSAMCDCTPFKNAIKSIQRLRIVLL